MELSSPDHSVWCQPAEVECDSHMDSAMMENWVQYSALSAESVMLKCWI